MTVFDRRRLPPSVFKLDVERMRQGWYSDKYFINIARHAGRAGRAGLPLRRHRPRPLRPRRRPRATWTSARSRSRCSGSRAGSPRCVVVGVDKALAMLRECTGYFDDAGPLREHVRRTWRSGRSTTASEAPYDGDVLNVTPVMRVRGRYRDFAILETPTLGALTRGSRVATNVYEVLKAARGKQVLFFPARFDAHEVQAADGYAYQVAVQLFNQNFGKSLSAYVSTDAQGDWWGGAGGGTVAHAAIACFLGDTAEATMAFAATRPADIPRIALVDFHNDCVGTSRAGDPRDVPRATWSCMKAGRAGGGAEVQALRRAPRHLLQHARRVGAAARRQAPRLRRQPAPGLRRCARRSTASGRRWDLAGEDRALAEQYCRDVKIAVTGGFTPGARSGSSRT